MKTALIGYGEVGRILAEDLRAQGVEVTAFDLKLRGLAADALQAHAAAHGVVMAASHAQALAGSEVGNRALPARHPLCSSAWSGPPTRPGPPSGPWAPANRPPSRHGRPAPIPSGTRGSVTAHQFPVPPFRR